MKKEITNNKVPLPWLLLSLLFVMLFFVAVVFTYLYNREKTGLLESVHNDIVSLSDLKANQLNAWINERASDANYLATLKEFQNILDKLENNPGTASLQNEAWLTVAQLLRNHNYKGLVIFDETGKAQHYIEQDRYLSLSPDTLKYFQNIIPPFFGGQDQIIAEINKNAYFLVRRVFAVRHAGWKIRALALLIGLDNDFFKKLPGVSLSQLPVEYSILCYSGSEKIELLLNRNKGAIIKPADSRIPYESIIHPSGVSAKPETFHLQNKDESTSFISFSPLKGRKFGIIAEINNNNIFPGRTDYIGIYSTLAIVFTILLCLFIIILIRQERKKYQRIYISEKELRETQNDFQMLVENQQEGVAILTKEGVIAFSNKALQSMFSADEPLTGKNINSFLDDSSSEELMKFLREEYDEKVTGKHFTISLRDDNNSTILISVSKKYSSSKYSEGYLCIFNDLGSLYRLEKSLKESNTFLRSLVDNFPSLVWLKTVDDKFVYANKSFTDAVGFDNPFAIVDKYEKDLVNPELYKRISEEDSFVINTRKPLNFEETDFSQGAVRWYEVTKIPVMGDDNNVTGILGVRTEITDRKNKEQILLKLAVAVSQERGRKIFTSIGEQLAVIVKADLVIIGEISAQKDHIKTLAFIHEHKIKENTSISLINTPFEKLLHEKEIIYHEGIKKFFPDLTQFIGLKCEAFFAFATYDSSGNLTGVVALSFQTPQHYPDEIISIARIFSVLVSAELENYMHEKELKKTETKLFNFVNQAQDGMIITDTNGNVIEWNKAMHLITGISSQQALGHSVWQLLPHLPEQVSSGGFDPITIVNRLSELKDYGDSGKVITISGELMNVNGEKKLIVSQLFPIWDENELLIGIIVRDITEEKLIEEEIARRNRWVDTLFENSPLALQFFDKDGYSSRMNEAQCILFGLPDKHYLIGEYNIFQDNRTTHLSLIDYFRRAYNGEVVHIPEYLDEIVIQKEDGTSVTQIKYLEQYIYPIIDSSGTVEGIVTTTIDITNSKNQSLAISKARDFYLSMFESIPALIWRTNADGVSDYCNKTYLDFAGVNSLEELLKKLDSMLHPDELHIHGKFYTETFLKRKSYSVQYRLKNKNGEYRWVKEFSEPYVDPEGNFSGFIGVCFDITDQINAIERIHESEERYKNLVENISDVVFRVDPYGVIVFISQVATRISGYTVEEIIGKSLFSFIYHEDRTFVEEALLKSLTEYQPALEFRIVNKAGEPIWVSANAQPFLEKGLLSGVQGTLTDINSRKKSELALKKSEERYKLISENAGDVIWVMDTNDFTLSFVSPSIEKMLGYKIEESEKTQIKNLLTQESYYYLIEDLQKRISTFHDGDDNQRIRLLELDHLHKNGNIVQTEVLTTLLYTNDRKVNGVVGVTRDITERKNTEKIVREQRDLLNGIFENIPVGMMLFDQNLNVINVNRAFTEITGYSNSEVSYPGNGWLPGNENRYLREEIYKKLREKQQFSGEYDIISKHKYPRIVELGITPLPDGRILVHLIDITLRKKMEAELIVAKEKAEESSRIKSSFLANMSHELRTPMMGILAFSSMLKDEYQEPQLVKIGQTIFQSGSRLLNTLNQILDLSRIEAQRLDMKLEQINVADVLTDSVKLFEIAASKKGLTLTLHIAEGRYISMLDSALLSQILSNLLNNAIKYTHTGSIQVSLFSSYIEEQTFLIISVKDTGIGIPAASLSVIFEEFRQVSEGFNRAFEGTGLGLTLTKKFVELMGGAITVKSEVDKGSEFIIQFPMLNEMNSFNTNELNSHSEEESVENILQAKSHISILMVENDETNAEVIAYFLKDYFKVTITPNGNEAIKLAEENNFDIMLMDINLGRGLSGIDVVKTVRAMGKYKSIPIIAMTAFAMKGDREEFLAAGCSHYISKPFTRTDLLNLLKNVIVEYAL